MTTVRLEDAIALGYCRRGCRAFAERHNLDWTKFRYEGLPAEAFLALDDEMANQAVAQAKQREESNGIE